MMLVLLLVLLAITVLTEGYVVPEFISSKSNINFIDSDTVNTKRNILSRQLLSKSRKLKSLQLINSENLLSEITTDALSSTSYSIPTSLSTFVPPEVGTEIYLGSAISLIPIIWATIEFNSRIQTQRNCLVCQGSGLVKVTRTGNALTRPRKCWSCGGFLPWLGWKMFFFSAFFDIGNGGPLQRPAKDYNEINDAIRQQRQQQAKEQLPNKQSNHTDVNS